MMKPCRNGMVMFSQSSVFFILVLPYLIITTVARRNRISVAALISSSLKGPPPPPSPPYPPPIPHHRRQQQQHRIDDRECDLPSTVRRDALVVGLGGVIGLVLPSPSGAAVPPDSDMVDLVAPNAARHRSSSLSSSSVVANHVGGEGGGRTIVPSVDPPPLLSIRGGKDGRSIVHIPRVGHSLYKTRPEDVARCVNLALRCGVRHFDVGTAYGSNVEAGVAFERYLRGDSSSCADEKQELLRAFDDVNDASRRHAELTSGYRSTMPSIEGSPGRRGRRNELFVSHKLSNSEQSTDPVYVKRRVKDAISKLGIGYLDLISIHSPLTDSHRRCNTYAALLDLRDAGFVRSVGVCNYGIGPLEELRSLVGEGNVSDLPAINQLELSPFNSHCEVIRYCDSRGISIECSAWSKLSGVDGPSVGWSVLSDLAKAKGMTKAQVLVRWSLQKGYVCVPRSGSRSKVERMAIAENSYGGVNPSNAIGGREDDDGRDASSSLSSSSSSPPSFVLTHEDMKVLDGLDVGYKAGKLGRRDGWDDDDVLGPDWDPTDVV